MRIYQNCAECASETKREVAEMGIEVKLGSYQDKNIKDDPNFFTKELIGYSYMIHEPKDKLEMLKAFNKEGDLPWCLEEFNERISCQRDNPGKAWKLRKNMWKEFLHNRKFSYTYSGRIGDQVEKVIEMLEDNPTSRNAMVVIWDRQIDQDRVGGKQRVPCSIDYQFLIRNDRINLIYHIRSNDVMSHYCFDVWMAIRLMEYVGERLHLPIGDFYHFIGSLHAYSRDLKGIF